MQVYVYHDEDTSEVILNGLRVESDIVRLIEITNVKGVIAGMFWRFLVANEATVDRYIVRDADCRVGTRERDAVNDWINSGRKFHAMKDSHGHGGIVMLGGMWGGVKDAIPASKLTEPLMAGELDKYIKYKGGDQHYLSHYIYPIAKESILLHNSYLCAKFPGSVPWPTQRPENWLFVGEARGILEVQHNNHKPLPECPPACRPPDHQDWIYC